MTRGLRGRWAKEYPTWRKRLAPLYKHINNVRLTILVWGPSEGWPYYAKRQQIIDHLSMNKYNEVMTSEELVKADPPPKRMHLHDVEKLHVRGADVVFVLVVKDDKVTGVQTEIAVFRNFSDFKHKAYLLTPKLTAKERQKSSFLKQGWVDYPAERQFQYTSKQYNDCTKIRSFCDEIVQRLRNERGLSELGF